MNNKDEVIASRLLESLRMGVVMHEPEGKKKFPDFSVGGQAVGVEVRRLNQHFMQRNGVPVGFEKAEFDTLPPLHAMLEEFGPSADGECWRVTIDYRRPITWKRLRQDTKDALTAFKAQEQRTPTYLAISETLGIELTRASKDCGAFFVPFVSADWDVGGNAAGIAADNLRTCIEAKERKVVPPIQSRYSAWWLILVNHIDKHMELKFYQGIGSDLDPPLAHPFDRVIIVDHLNHTNWVEL